MGSRDQGGEDAKSRFFHAAQEPGDGRVHHQRQREQEPVEQLRPRAAHLADDHLALWEQKGMGDKLGQPQGSQEKVLQFSPRFALGEGGETGLRFKMGLVSGEKCCRYLL